MKKILVSVALIAASFTSFAQVGVGTDMPDASAALDVESTTKGILVPRMDVTQRDAVASPANGLLIFNTSNSKFEVYKEVCSCWVQVSDAGTTASVPLVDTPPYTTNRVVNGEFRVGGTATISYTYVDSQLDAEGPTTILWQVANDASGGGMSTFSSTATSDMFTATEAGRYVRYSITPRAAAGILNGDTVTGPWTLIDGATVPYASAVAFTGTTAQAEILEGTYTFTAGSAGNPEATDGSTYIWQRANNAEGSAGVQTIVSDTTRVRLTSADINHFVRFGVKSKDDTGSVASSYVYSAWQGPVTYAAEAAPVAENVTFSPDPGANVTLSASYTFFEANNDGEGATTFKWYTATDAMGTGQAAIAGVTSSTFEVTNAQAGMYIGVGITPVALTGNLTGTEVVYYNLNPSVAAAVFTFTGNTSQSNSFYANAIMDGVTDGISVEIDVTTAGSIAFSSDTVNGYSFSGGGTYTAGTQWVTLLASGVQTGYSTAGDAFTITGLGSAPIDQAVMVANVKVGADFALHYNGITAGASIDETLVTYTSGETFSSNSVAASKPISASACAAATVTGASGTVYNTININGQCWMTENLKELPGGVAIDVNKFDGAGYGYYGTTTWGTTEPAAGEGILYQWDAAMNGSTAERAQGVCPTGFHIPSDAEWMYLEHGLGMALSEQAGTSWRANTSDDEGTPGYKLRSVGTGATNVSGFSGLLAGGRSTDGTFYPRASSGHWWSSSATSTTTAYYRGLNSGLRGVRRSSGNKAFSFSVRCLQD